MDELIHYQFNQEQQFGIITLNRAEKRHAISKEMTIKFLHCIELAKKDPLKFLIVTSTGERMFCSGGDLNDLHGELTPNEAEEILLMTMEVLYQLAVFPVPTIALLNGGAAGGGCELASACDIRIAKQGTKFGFVQTKLGIIPGWGGGVLLAKRVAPSFANQWIMEGTVYNADDLALKGWVHRVVTDSEWDDRDNLLKAYTSKSYKQMKILKELYLEEIGVIGLKKRMEKEVRYCASLWDSEEHKEAVSAFLNRS
jgi:enoyl-CoA hydratase